MGSLSEDRPGDTGLAGSQRRVALMCVLIFTFMGMFDSSVITVALPTIARDLQVSEAAAVWALNAYNLAGAMTILTSSALGERLGFRRVFVSGVVLFTLASLGSALAGSLPWLVAMRFLQGLGGYAAMSVSPALFRTIFPLRLLGAVLGINAMVVALTASLGPTVGGVLIGVVHWSWIFALNVPVGVVATWLMLRSIPDDRGRGGPFDSAGALLAALTMGAFVLGVGQLGQLADAGSGWAAGFFVVAALCGGLFVLRQRSTPAPLLQLAIFRHRRFSIATCTAIAAFVGQGMAFIALPFLFQSSYGFSPLASALLFTPWPVAIVFAAPLSGRLADRYGAALLASTGLLLLGLGLALLALLRPAPASTPDIAWRVFICGLGFGLFQTPNNREFMSSTPEAMLGNASGMLTMSRTFGQAMGATVVSIVLSLYAAGERAGQALFNATGAIAALWVAAAAVLLAAVISALRLRPKPISG
ncbi:MAG: MFS transporter [Variovorax sp.]|nr:MAG: MFS transporter [Variovorax sp.]